ncbi:ankyrin, partial [Anaeromyces robustus]
DINVKDIYGEYPIITAFYTYNIDIINYLLDHGASGDVKNTNGSSLLSLAIHKNQYSIIKCLLRKPININVKDASDNYPLMKAISQNAMDIVMVLANYGRKHNIDMNIKNMNGDTPLTLSYRLNYQNIFRYLVSYLDINQKDSDGNNVLYYAIDQEDTETINYLINHKIDVNSKNNLDISCLDYAISKGSSILNILLKNKHDNIIYNIPNSQGEIPLITIIKTKNFTSEEKEDIINCLLEKGSNVNYIDKHGNSPLIYAIQKKSLSIVKLLIKNGANINYLNKSNHKTILKYAVDMGQVDIVKYLAGK